MIYVFLIHASFADMTDYYSTEFKITKTFRTVDAPFASTLEMFISIKSQVNLNTVVIPKELYQLKLL